MENRVCPHVSPGNPYDGFIGTGGSCHQSLDIGRF